MDALALLCTLHADGPATLKRLRSRGYTDLATLIQRSAEVLSADLEVEPAYARRLLREAKHLAVRVGAEGLEAEEAPPVATNGVAHNAGYGKGHSSTGYVDGEEASQPMPPSIPVTAPQAGEPGSTLDASDRSLVERIVGLPGQVEGVPSVEASSVDPEKTIVEAEMEPVPEPEVPLEPGLLTADSLPGLDAELVTDLHASGIRTLSHLAKAESLQLTRALGITFAQARRLGFLARRAALATDAAPAPVPVAVPPEAAVQAAEHPKVPAPAPRAEPIAEPPVEPPAEREPFWAPRKFLAENTVPETATQQGVKVDPSEIAPRPRFGDRLAQAAARSREAARPAYSAPPAAQPIATRSSAESRSGKTVLGWNFEIPRPVEEPALPLGSVAIPLDADSASGSAVAESINGSTIKRSREYSAGVSVPRHITKDQDGGGPFA